VDIAEWRAWLAEHGATEREAWLVIPRGSSGIGYSEAVEQALCFGWIDGLHRRRDDTSSVLRFTPRRPGSTWSRVNRERAERMIAEGLMADTGQRVIDRARADGSWLVGEVVPDDLRARLDAEPAAAGHFARFPPSSTRLILEWIAAAKRPETRERRIAETVSLAAQGLRAHHPAPREPSRSS
jgi:uncharacterized protein YdeI (YjbR/CyaY-like superfamily)